MLPTIFCHQPYGYKSPLAGIWDCQQLTAVLRYAGSLVHWKI